jgi:hypothetical protein
MNKVFVICAGCRYSGADPYQVRSNLITAIEAAQELMRASQRDADARWRDNTTMNRRLEWREAEEYQFPVVKCWHNAMNEVIIYEYDLLK